MGLLRDCSIIERHLFLELTQTNLFNATINLVASPSTILLGCNSWHSTSCGVRYEALMRLVIKGWLATLLDGRHSHLPVIFWSRFLFCPNLLHVFTRCRHHAEERIALWFLFGWFLGCRRLQSLAVWVGWGWCRLPSKRPHIFSNHHLAPFNFLHWVWVLCVNDWTRMYRSVWHFLLALLNLDINLLGLALDTCKWASHAHILHQWLVLRFRRVQNRQLRAALNHACLVARSQEEPLLALPLHPFELLLAQRWNHVLSLFSRFGRAIPFAIKRSVHRIIKVRFVCSRHLVFIWPGEWLLLQGIRILDR